MDRPNRLSMWILAASFLVFGVVATAFIGFTVATVGLALLTMLFFVIGLRIGEEGMV